jgi:hypothetical protein
MQQMLPEPTEELVRDYFRTMVERHRADERKWAGLPPLRFEAGLPRWSDDPIIAKYRICSPFRERDWTTIWVRRHVREAYARCPHLPFMLTAARLINLPTTLRAIGNPIGPAGYDPDRVAAAIRTHGVSLAYGRATTGRGDGDRGYNIAFNVLMPLWECPLQLEGLDSLEAVWRLLRTRLGLGDFLSYETCSDLRWTRWLEHAADTQSFAVAGPGAEPGLDLLFGGRLRGRQYLEAMRRLLELAPAYLPADFPQIELREIEHWCCEWRKICAARDGKREGARYLYVPRPPQRLYLPAHRKSDAPPCPHCPGCQR